MKEKKRYQEANLAFLLLAGLLAIWAVGSYATRSTTIGMVYGCVNLTVWPMLSWLLGREMRCVERDKDALTRTIWGLLGLYVVQKLLIFWSKIASGKNASLNFLNDENTAWLYLCGAVWFLLAVLIQRKGWSHTLVLVASIVLGCAVGYLPAAESYLCLIKLFVFFPLFLVGFWGLPDRVEELLNRNWVRVLSLVALLAVAGGCLVASGPLYNNVGFLTAANAYASLSNTWLNTFGGLFRLAWYGVVAVVGAALLSVMPRKKLPLLTLCGKRWFSVYFWLRPVTYFLFARIVKVLISCGRLGKIDAVLICLVVLPLLGLHSLETATKGIFHWYGWLKTMPKRFGHGGRKSWRPFLILYSICFFLILSVIYSYYNVNGKSLVWSPDGQNLYLVIMYYTRDYILQAISGFFKTGKLVFSQWDFSIGQGNSVLQVAHFNPLFLLAMLVPEKYMEYVYGFITLFQVYLVGLAFSVYCHAIHKRETIPVIAGALVYAFSGFGLFTLTKHIYFITYLMLGLPLLLLGCERWLQKRKWGTFVLVVFLMLLGGYYYTYINSLLMAVYLIIRQLYVNGKNLKKSVLEILHLIGLYLWGLALSMVAFLPSIILYLNCSRSGGGNTNLSLFYSSSYYSDLFSEMFAATTGPGSWTRLGFTALSAIALVLLFVRWKKKEWKHLRLSFLLLLLFLCIPFVGYAFNGFGYVTNRWSYGVAFFMGLVMVYVLPAMAKLTRKEMSWIAGILLVYVSCALLLNNGNIYVKWGTLLIVITLALVIALQFIIRHPKVRQQALLLTLIVLLLFRINAYYDSDEQDYTSSSVNAASVYSGLQNSTEQVASNINDDSFYRVEVHNNRKNQFCLTGGYGTSSYWSALDGRMVSYYLDFELNSAHQLYALWGLDERASLCALASVKYFVGNNAAEVPYGYEALYSEKGATVYENQYALPLGYTYSSLISRSEYDALSPLEKQQAILQGAVIEDNVYENLVTVLPATNVDLTVTQLDYTISDVKDVTIDGTTYISKAGGTITLEFDGVDHAETYLYLKGCKAEGLSGDSGVIYVSSGDVTKRSDIYTSSSIYYFETDGYTYNMGYSDEGKSTVQIKFSKRGTYHIEDIQVICLPMSDYEEDVTALAQTVLENVEEAGDTVTGFISLNSTKLLTFSVPYSSGWTLYINGSETELLEVNGMYCGVVLEPGEYTVELRYTMPGLVPGAVISLMAAAGVCVVLLHHRPKRRAVKKASGPRT